MRALAARMARLEGSTPTRVVVATGAPDSSVEEEAKVHGFPLFPTDLLVFIEKPDGCERGTIKAYGGNA